MKRPVKKRIEPANVYVRKSTLPGAGKGLFARDLITKGDIIIEYKGIITTYAAVQDKNNQNPYVYFVSNNHVIDALPCPESLGRYANDAEGLMSMQGCVNNAKFIVKNKRVYFEALVDILPGSEIFIGYGQDYWDKIRFNLDLKKTRDANRGRR